MKKNNKSSKKELTCHPKRSPSLRISIKGSKMNQKEGCINE